MQTKLFALTIALTLFTTACTSAPEAAKENKEVSAAQPAAEAAALPKVDYAAIAQKLVEQCAGIKEGEIVEISGEIKDNELLRELSHAVRKLGAFPLVQTYKQDLERQKRMMQEMPAKWDSQVNQLGLKLAGFVNANIRLFNADPVNFMEEFPQERTEAMRKANEPINALRRKRGIRNIQLGGNGLYPSKTNAERLGLTQAELANIFWNGVNADYTQLQADGEKYRQLLAAAKEVHLTHPNGTDLKVRIEKRPVFVSDGVVSAEDVKRGGPATTVYLPAGEVYVTAVPGTAEGRVVSDHELYIGATGSTPIEGLTFDFKAGKMVSVTARSGLEAFNKAYNRVTGKRAEGKDQFGSINLGINRNLVLGPKAKGGDYAPAGMVSVGFGGNEQYGGENKAAGGWESNLPGCTLKLDGKVIVENGVLQ